jgi:hypothetical protein
MKYMLLIYQNPANWTGLSEEDREAVMNEAGAIVAELSETGEWIAGDGLADSSQTRTVRVRGGVPAVTERALAPGGPRRALAPGPPPGTSGALTG